MNKKMAKEIIPINGLKRPLKMIAVALFITAVLMAIIEIPLQIFILRRVEFAVFITALFLYAFDEYNIRYHSGENTKKILIAIIVLCVLFIINLVAAVVLNRAGFA